MGDLIFNTALALFVPFATFWMWTLSRRIDRLEKRDN